MSGITPLASFAASCWALHFASGSCARTGEDVDIASDRMIAAEIGAIRNLKGPPDWFY
jgi:hypothetical protein